MTEETINSDPDMVDGDPTRDLEKQILESEERSQEKKRHKS
ncbi:hypothetical protein PC118_g17005 [Phytophthora cactorum]|uniref:Uncharacterized protein n=1 Tax=Phytophthora cactorum TaxID=29920 RepID=A0A8T1FCR1_9STRA|nr:hypothetical protein PC114_g16830 [Phytophthora cactorum]KAG2970220.1 hypothetical protein PC118_g17005 [Phytophthora cactorum]KAG2987976.1 hypothetical protein PC120_g23500 [Phytophthora cactorum]KAG3001361.1 hypothetical protein PC119_g16745 [Phytophthora cactorum]KAG3043447.1 hypothetical protein PC121_g22539 [Phytophthora cactorum]